MIWVALQKSVGPPFIKEQQGNIKMKLMNPIKSTILFSILSLGSSWATAGTVITMTERVSEQEPTGEFTLQVGNRGVRMEQRRAGQEHALIYRSDQNLVWIIDPTNETYTEFTQGDLQKMTAQLDQAFAEMQEQLAALPPEERAQTEEMLRQQGINLEQKSVQVIQVQKVGKETINEREADHYQGSIEGQNVMEFWIVSAAELGIPEGDQKTLASMEDFLDELGVITSRMAGEPGVKVDEGLFSRGVPVKSIRLENDEPQEISELKEVRQEELSDKLFQEPTAFTKRDIGEPPAE
jgi:hypothetical protein